MRLGQLLGAAAVAGMLWASNAYADLIYSVDLPSSGSFTISGTITTDGTTGTLSLSNILAADITLSGPGGLKATLDLADLVLSGVDLTATKSGIYFNYSGTDGGTFYGTGNGGVFALCSNPGPVCGVPETFYYGLDGNNFFAFFSGDQLIADAVPEPGTLALFGLGLFAFAGLSLRRKFAGAFTPI